MLIKYKLIFQEGGQIYSPNPERQLLDDLYRWRQSRFGQKRTLASDCYRPKAASGNGQKWPKMTSAKEWTQPYM